MTVYEVGTYGFAWGWVVGLRRRNWHLTLPVDFYFVPWPSQNEPIGNTYTLQYL